MFNIQKSSRLLIVSLLVIAVTTATATAGWMDYLNPFSYFTSANEPTSANLTPEGSTVRELQLSAFLPPDTRTVCNSGTPDFATVASAVADANAAVPANGRTYLVCAGHTETSPAGGYSITATGASAANPVTFIKDGAGTNPTITAPTTHTVGALNDAIFKIIGADNITIDGFTLLENGANVTTAAATNNMTEFGVALLYASTTNGAQNITIQNNTITLNRTYQNTWGIYSNSTHSATIVTTTASATTTAGGNSAMKVYGNTISNVNQGIVVLGPAAAADYNTGIDIGGIGGVQANSITNWGTTGTFSGYANVSGTLNCILVRNSLGFNVSFNTLTSSVGGNTTTSSERAIYVPSFSVSPTGTFTNNINSNIMSVQSGLIAGTVNGIFVEATTSTATGTININGNNFATMNHTVAGTGAVTMINSAMPSFNTSISNNTFTNLTTNTTGSVTFIGNAISVPTSGGTQTINGNSIVTAFSKTGAGGTVTAFTSNSSSVTGSIISMQTNNFSNITLTGVTGFVGINNTDGGSPTKTISGNTFSNISGGSGTFNPMTVNFFGAASSVSSNTISNIASGAGITALTIGGSSSATSLNINSNTINNISSAVGTVTGLSVASPSAATNISKNKIYDIGGSNTSTNGILIPTGPLAVTLFNNLVGNLTASAATLDDSVRGISITSTTLSSTIRVYYNTLYLAAPSGGANFGSTGLFHAGSGTATTANLDLRNNIIVNNSAHNGGGSSVAFRRGGSGLSLNNYATSSNNNLFYAGIPGATNLIYLDALGNTAQTLAAYKAGVFTAGTISPRDLASISENPTFSSTVGSLATFLHINTVTPTQIESGGANIATFTDDYDGDTRNSSTPDIGADEFAGTGLDLSAPTVTYTALGNTASLVDRTLTTTIADATGVPTSGAGLPTLYWRINAGAYTPVTAVYVSGSTYTFTFGAGAVAPDTVSYYIVAQDTASTPNVGSTPAGGSGFSINPPAASTPPVSQSTYTIVPSILGTKTVGSAPGSDYPTLTAAIAAINGAELSGAVVLSLTDTSYTTPAETFPLVINANTGSSATNTITIVPATGVTSAISGSIAGCLISVNGADYVTFDGSNNATTSRNLTVTNTNVSTSGAVLCLQTASGSNGATNNSFKNMNIVGNAPMTTLFGIFSGATGTPSASSLGTGNNSNTIQNNNISKSQFGIYSQGASIGAKNTGNTIMQNLMITTSPNQVTKGILVGFEDNITITENNISGLSGSTTSYAYGISLGLTSTTATTTTGNEVTNAFVRRNTIGSVRASSTFGVAGIMAASAATGTNRIINNAISDANSNGTTGDIGAGIYIGGGAGSTQIFFNSVQMAGTFTGGAGGSFAVAINGSNPVVDMRDNIFTSTGTTGANQNRAIGLAYSSVTNLTSDYNDLFVSGTSSGIGQTGTLAATGGVLSTTVASWRTNSGKDSNSLNDAANNPNFSSSADLRPGVGSPVLDVGTSLSSIFTSLSLPYLDNLGTTRVDPPSIGAYESGVDIVGPAITYSALGNTSSTDNRSLAATIADASVVASGAVAPRIYYRKGSGAYFSQACTLSTGTTTTGTWDCLINNADLGGVAGADVISYFVIAQDALGNVSSTPSTGLVASNVNSVTTPPTAPNSYTIVATFAGSINVGSSETITSLTNAGGLFARINAGAISGDVTVNLTSDLTGETGAVSLNQTTEEGAGNWTVIIKPGASPRIVSGSSSTCLINLNGADRIVIDGAVSGTTKDMTISNTNTSGATICFVNSATGNSLKNSIVKGVSTSTSNGVVFFSTVSIGTIGNSTNTIQNNDLSGGATAAAHIVFNSGSSTAKNTNNLITQNRIFDFSNTGIRDDGNSVTATYSRNEIFEQTTQTTALTGFRPSATNIDGFTFTRNYIHDLSTSSTGTVLGIHLYDTSSVATSEISNNMITLSSTAPLSLRGIYDQTATGEKYSVYFNSIYLSGTVAGASNSEAYYWSVASTTNARNNIFVNARTGGSGKHYAYRSNTTLGSLTSDYNNIYNPGGTGNVFGNDGTADRANLAAWQTAISKDANSKSGDPLFTSTTDLHILNNGAVSLVARGGVTIGVITTDFDSDTRKATPDIGADEFSTYLLSYTAGANGSLTGSVSQIVNPGGSGTAVTAVPNSGYTFVNWSDGNTNAARTDTNVTTSATYTANFAINQYTLAYTAGANGTISGTTPQTVNHGSSGIAVTAVPNTGYSFVNWSDGNTNATRTDTNVTASATYTASFAINQYTLAYMAGANGTISGTTPQTVNHGSSGIAVTAVPNTGYSFVNWSDASVANPRTDTNVTSNISVSANFAINQYTLTYSGNGETGGTAPTDPNSPYNFGASATVVGNTGSLVKAGYTFSGWNTAADGTGTNYAPAAAYSIPASNSILYARWIDTVAPVTTITGGPANSSYSNSSSASFTFTVTDTGGSGVAAIECKLDTGVFAACTSPQTFTGLGEGPHIFTVRGTDVAGNQSTDSRTWTVDTVAPDTSITSSPSNPSNSSSASFAFTGTDVGGSGVASFECDLDGGGFAACSTPKSYPGLAEGSHTFQVRAKDGASNTDASPATFTWVVDTIVPDTTIVTNPSNPSNSSSATFTFSATGFAQAVLYTYECSLESAPFTSCSASGVAYTGLGDGMHTFRVRATDTAGNTDASPATYAWSIDTVVPVVAAYTPLGTAAPATAQNFTVVVSDNVAVASVAVRYSVNGGAEASAACVLAANYDCTIPGLGLHDVITYYVRATDTAGNIADSPTPFSNLYSVGSATIPTGTYAAMSVAGGSTLGGDVTVTGNVALGGVLTTGTFTLTIDCNGTFTGAGFANYVIGKVAKQFCSTGVFTFPGGTAADNNLVGVPAPPEYTPMTATINSGTFPSSLTVSVTDSTLPGLFAATSVSRYWTVTETGDLNVDMEFTYLDAPFDVNGNEANYKVFRRTAGTSTQITPFSLNNAANTATVTGVANFSDWGIGDLAPTAAAASVSGRVTTADGRGIVNAVMVVSGASLPHPITVRTSSFGYYAFENLDAGQTYVITVNSKRFAFTTPSRVVTVNDNVVDFDFVAEE